MPALHVLIIAITQQHLPDGRADPAIPIHSNTLIIL